MSYQNDVLNVSIRETLAANSYQTVFVFEDALDLSDGAGTIEFQMKASDTVQLLLRFEDVNGKRVDLVDFRPSDSNEFTTFQFDINNRYASSSEFDPTQIKELHIRKIDEEAYNTTLVIDELRLGFEIMFPDSEAPSVPTDLTLSDVTETSATLNWSASSDNVGVVGYKIFVNDTVEIETTELFYEFENLEGTYNFQVAALDEIGNQSDKSEALTATFEATTVTSSTSMLKDNITVYPVPSTQYVHIKGQDVNEVYLISLSGELLRKTDTEIVNISDLPEGLFVLRIHTGSGVVTKVIAKQ